MSAILVRVAGRPPLPNTNARRNWRVAAVHQKDWKRRAWTEATLAKPPGWQPLAACTMHVEFVVPDRRRRDLDNLIASTKPLTDGIVEAGVLVDDSTDVIREVRYSVRYAKGESATEYRIEAQAA